VRRHRHPPGVRLADSRCAVADGHARIRSNAGAVDVDAGNLTTSEHDHHARRGSRRSHVRALGPVRWQRDVTADSLEVSPRSYPRESDRCPTASPSTRWKPVQCRKRLRNRWARAAGWAEAVLSRRGSRVLLSGTGAAGSDGKDYSSDCAHHDLRGTSRGPHSRVPCPNSPSARATQRLWRPAGVTLAVAPTV
jgi:hypothetical protein